MKALLLLFVIKRSHQGKIVCFHIHLVGLYYSFLFQARIPYGIPGQFFCGCVRARVCVYACVGERERIKILQRNRTNRRSNVKSNVKTRPRERFIVRHWLPQLSGFGKCGACSVCSRLEPPEELQFESEGDPRAEFPFLRK